MRHFQIKLLAAPLLFALLALTACQKEARQGTSSNEVAVLNGDLAPDGTAAVPGVALASDSQADPNDQRDNTPEDADVDDHAKMPHVLYATTNGKFPETDVNGTQNSQFNFHAEKDLRKQTKNVHGEVDYNFKAGGFKIKGKVTNIDSVGAWTCAKKRAEIHGIITKVEGKVPPQYSFVQPGKKFVFSVDDNNDCPQKQKDQGPDQISDFIVYTNQPVPPNDHPQPTYNVKGHVEVDKK